MPELTPTEALLALMRDVDDRKVLEREEDCKPYLELPGEEPADVSQAVWAMNLARWVWLPPDTLVWHLTDRGREVLHRGAP
jgi:hypothetical protein